MKQFIHFALYKMLLAVMVIIINTYLLYILLLIIMNFIID